MKNRLSIIIAAVTMTALVLTASVISVQAGKDKEKSLVLKEHNGCVTLFENEEISRVYDEIVISVLPESDRRLLKEGISIENEEQLASIIEDYDG